MYLKVNLTLLGTTVSDQYLHLIMSNTRKDNVPIKATEYDQFSSYLKDVRKLRIYPMIIQNIFSLWSTNLSITRSKNHTKLRRGFWYGGPVPEKSGCCAVYLKNTKLAVMKFCRQRNLWNRVMSQLIDLLITNKIDCLFIRSFFCSKIQGIS